MLRAPVLLLSVLLFSAPAARAIVVAPFGPNGTYQRAPGPPVFQIGSGGFVEEIDAFVRPDGAPVATRLSTGAVPAGLALSFSATLSADQSDLLLTYEFLRTAPAPLGSLTFLSFVDLEIDETLNTFFNEYGEMAGAPAPGQGWEIDEPGFVSGNLFANALAGVLDGTNAVPASTPDDVAMALSFALGPLGPGQIARFEVMLSQDGDAIGGLALCQLDADPRSTTVVTYSGRASVVPEPGTALLLGAGITGVALRRRAQTERRAR